MSNGYVYKRCACRDPETRNRRKRVEDFLRDALHAKISVEYRGKLWSTEEVFDKWLRCNLVHEGELPIDIQFMDESKPGIMSFRAGGAPEYVLKIGCGWFHFLMNTADKSPELH
jgi:hypothetical protein